MPCFFIEPFTRNHHSYFAIISGNAHLLVYLLLLLITNVLDEQFELPKMPTMLVTRDLHVEIFLCVYISSVSTLL